MQLVLQSRQQEILDRLGEPSFHVGRDRPLSSEAGEGRRIDDGFSGHSFQQRGGYAGHTSFGSEAVGQVCFSYSSSSEANVGGSGLVRRAGGAKLSRTDDRERTLLQMLDFLHSECSACLCGAEVQHSRPQAQPGGLATLMSDPWRRG